MVGERPNWKKANEESHNGVFRTALDERKDEVSGVMSQKQPTREAIVDTADTIREAQYDSMKRTVPAVRIYQHSVLYWDEELSAIHNKRVRAKEACRWQKQRREPYPKV